MNSSVPAGSQQPQAVAQSAQAATQTQARTALDKPVPKADGTIVYDSVPKPLHGIASVGFECCQVKEFGDGVNLTHTGRLDTVSVVMDSWGCQNGHWYSNDCTTSANATFSVPITLNVYAVTNTGSRVGALLGTQTQTFAIPYRPSADHVRCVGPDAGKFFSAVDQAMFGDGCDNGLSNLIVFDYSGLGVQLPSQAIFTVAFNTSTSGYNPYGTATACYTSSGGCGYDSLNVGADGNGGPVGSAFDPNGAFVNYSLGTNYCDHGAGGSNFVRLDTGTNCWTGFHPQIQVTTSDKHDNDDKSKHKDKD